MDEQRFADATARLEQINQVVEKLDPAIRSQAFAALSAYVSPHTIGDATATLGATALPAGDIDALVVRVMLEASAEAENDLREIMGELKAATAAKRRLRLLISKLAIDVAENSSSESDGHLTFCDQGLGSEAAYHRIELPVPDPRCDGAVRLLETDLHSGPITQVSQLRWILDAVKDQNDSLSEISTLDSLRLQMAMDRRSRLISTLSNIMKKLSDTDNTLVQNLK
jgi:hypothetical protein